MADAAEKYGALYTLLVSEYQGVPCTKESVTRLMQVIPAATEHGDLIITGHSMRVGGQPFGLFLDRGVGQQGRRQKGGGGRGGGS